MDELSYWAMRSGQFEDQLTEAQKLTNRQAAALEQDRRRISQLRDGLGLAIPFVPDGELRQHLLRLYEAVGPLPAQSQ